MPLIRITSSARPTNVAPVLAELSRTAAELFGKPERWVMTCIDPVAVMTFGGSDAPAAYVEVKNIGDLSAALAERVSKSITPIISQGFGVPPDRVYIEMSAARGEHWGYNGSTFA